MPRVMNMEKNPLKNRSPWMIASVGLARRRRLFVFFEYSMLVSAMKLPPSHQSN
jgi:hypothetical protein